MWPRIPNLLPVFIALSSFVKFDAVCEKHEWDKLNEILDTFPERTKQILPDCINFARETSN